MKRLIFILSVCFLTDAVANAQQKLIRQVEKAVLAELPKNVEVLVQDISAKGWEAERGSVRVLSPHPPIGRVSLEMTDAKTQERSYGNASVRAFAKVAVARRGIQRGERFSSDNVRFEKRELGSHQVTGFYLSWSGLKSQKAVGFIAPSALIGRANAAPVPLVARGEPVQMNFQQGPLKISGRYFAMEKGMLGDWVQIQHPQTKKIVRARVVARGEVAYP